MAAGRPLSYIPRSTARDEPFVVLIENWMRSHEGPPRMTTTQRNSLTNLFPGLQIFNTSTNQMNYWNGSAWVAW